MKIAGRIAVLAVSGAVLLGSACSSTDDSQGAPVTTVTTAAPATAAATLVGPEAFAARMGEPGVVTINVHVPDEGHLEGTDLTIPFDQISESADLPSDRSTPLAVYCRSGNMSADAVVDLAAMGYTDIVELEGGFNAWVDSGRPLEPPGS